MGTNRIEEKILFTKDECNIILNSVDNNYTNSQTIDSTGVSKENNYRTSTQNKIKIEGELKNLLLNKLSHFGVSDFPTFGNIVKYKVGEYFKKHEDRGDNYPHRYKTLIIQLSADDDYDGGKLVLYDNKKIKPIDSTIGNTLIFNSNILHEVTPVTNGVRYTFVCWLRKKDLNIDNITSLI
jgi:predicted 2-oxoglutarate/Fe(II)-dependent dioxygenase YbiX